MSKALEVAVQLRFVGPFSWPGTSDAPSVFDTGESRHGGVHVWTVPQPAGHLVYYVGETGKSFAQRMLEHHSAHASGFYRVYSPAALAHGVKVPIWPGRFDPAGPKTGADCVKRYADLAPYLVELSRLYRFFLAPARLETRLRRRVEAALAGALYAAPGRIGAFQDRGIRYAARRAEEEPIACGITSSEPLLGVPTHLLV